MKITQQFLDTVQYESDAILKYEMVYGEDFVSPGGRALSVELIPYLNVNQGDNVLDVGCGLGGSAFIMAQSFGLNVFGIDLSMNMIVMAKNKLRSYGLQHKVEFEQGDCLLLESTDQFHGIYSRDVFLHIHNKTELFKVLYNALKEKGHLVFTD